MNILIFGSGAVGRYLTAHLAQVADHTVLISRSNTTQLHETGISVSKNNGKEIVRAQPFVVPSLRKALIKADELGQPFDYILLTTKSYDLPDVIDHLVAYTPQPPPLITMQNGIDIEQLLTQQFGKEKVIAGSLTVPVSYDHQLNIVEERPDRGIVFASPAGTNNHKPVANLFSSAGLNVTTAANHRSLKWSKALTNMIGNATSAIVNRQPGVLYKYKPIFQLEMKMLEEALAVMKKQHIPITDLPGTSVKRLAFGVRWLPRNWFQSILTKRVAKGRGDKMPSFQIDLAAGKEKNEVLYHNGAVYRIGQEVGVPTPVNAALNDILLGIARGERDWDQYSGKPKRLLATVRKHIQQQKTQAKS